MDTVTIALGSDHAGYALKEHIKAHLAAHGVEVVDCGTNSPDPCDYPDFVIPAARMVAARQAAAAVVIGGSGNGEAIAANKVRGVRCALGWSVATARLAREHNDANVLALGARFLSPQEAVAIVEAWRSAEFQGGRHQRRLAKISAFENAAASED